MCWAYTLAANLEISFLQAGAGLFDLSEEHLAYFFAHRMNDSLGNTANDKNEVLHPTEMEEIRPWLPFF